MHSPNASSLADGSLFNSVTSDTKSLHEGWPFSLMLTMHVVNLRAHLGATGHRTLSDVALLPTADS